MEHTHSAIERDNTRSPLGHTSDPTASYVSWPGDHCAQPALALEQIAFTGRERVGGNSKPGEAAISSIETAVTPQQNHAAQTPANIPILNYEQASEEELLAGARSSDSRAFAELSNRCTPSVHRIVFRMLRNQEDTEDVVQEAVLRAYTRVGEFRGSCSFSTWLTKIAINCSLMLLRKRRLHTPVSLDQGADGGQTWALWELTDPYPNAEQSYARQQTNDLLSHAIQRLPWSCRNLVEQYYRQEQSLQEAADSHGITVAAAKSRLLRARVMIRTILERSHISTAGACY